MKDTIKPFGLFASLVVTSVGVGIFTYPREITKYVKTNGWNVVLIAGMLFMIIIYVMSRVIKLNNYDSFSKIVTGLTGKWIGGLILLIFNAYLILSVSIQMRNYIVVVKKYLLERTPTEFLVVTLILASVILTNYSKVTLVRFNEITFFLMFIPMAIMLIVLLKEFDITNILPIGYVPVKQYVRSIYPTLWVYSGFEVIFLFAPMLNDRKKILKSSIIAMVFITVFFSIITIFCLGIFSQYQLVKLMWPTITMVSTVEIPGAFVERWEGFIMAMWIIYNFTTAVNILYFSCNMLAENFGLIKEKIVTIILVPIMYYLSLYPSNVEAIKNIMNKIINPLILGNIITLPIILFILTKIKIHKKGGIMVNDK